MRSFSFCYTYSIKCNNYQKKLANLKSTKDIIDSDKNSENVPRLENVEVVLVHCNLVNNSYKQASKVLFTFVQTKQYGQLISISPHSRSFFKNDEHGIFRN